VTPSKPKEPTMKKLLALALLTGAGYAVPAHAEVKTVTCESRDRDERVCQLPKRTQQVVISRQLSDQNCNRGRNWDVRKVSGHDELWVRNGCRAEFTVRYDK
jgi:hypothetical protein